MPIYVYICVCIHAYTYSLPLEPPSHLPPHSTLLRWHRELDLSSLHHNSKFPPTLYFTYVNVYVLRRKWQCIPVFLSGKSNR